jgi:hypothetical protein
LLGLAQPGYPTAQGIQGQRPVSDETWEYLVNVPAIIKTERGSIQM